MTHLLLPANRRPAERAARQTAWRLPTAAERPSASRLNVHIGYGRAVLAYLRQQGVNPAGLYPAELLQRVEQADTGTTFALHDFHAVIDAAQAHLRDPDLPMKAAECERQRGYLRALEDGNRIFQTTTSGEREVIDDARREAELRRVRESLIKNCA